MKRRLIDFYAVVNELANITVSDDLFGMGMQAGIDLALEKMRSFTTTVNQEETCECCHPHNDLDLGAKVYYPYVNYFVVGDGAPCREKHKFCPICGRKMYVEDWNDEESNDRDPRPLC